MTDEIRLGDLISVGPDIYRVHFLPPRKGAIRLLHKYRVGQRVLTKYGDVDTIYYIDMHYNGTFVYGFHHTGGCAEDKIVSRMCR